MTTGPTGGLVQERISELRRARGTASARPRPRPLVSARNGVGVALERLGQWLQVQPGRELHRPLPIAH